jgi:hypothetical protein
MLTGSAIDSVFGVGAQTGGETAVNCPENMVVTGFAGGASPIQVWRAMICWHCTASSW